MWQSKKEETLCGTAIYEQKENYIYGQFNFFFQISLPSDSFVHGLLLASTTCRRHTTVDKVDYIIADHDGDSYFVHKMFTTLDDVYSTPVLQVAFQSKVASMKKHADEYFVEEEYNHKTQVFQQGRTRIVPTIDYNDKKRVNQQKTVVPPSTTSQHGNFDDRIRRRIRDLKQNTTPYFLGTVTDNEILYDYANSDEKQNVSYLVMLDMYRNRKYIRYEPSKDAEYREVSKGNNFDISIF